MAQKNRRLSWWTTREEIQDGVTVRILKPKHARKSREDQAWERERSKKITSQG